MKPTFLVAAVTMLLIAGYRSYAGAKTIATDDPVSGSEIGTQAGSRYHGDALAVSETRGGALLHCGFQQMVGEATREGLWLTSTVRPGGEHFQVSATAVGRDGATITAVPATGSVRVEDSLVQWERAGITEEYSVNVDGVRQDFIIRQRPFGSGDLRVELKVVGAKATQMACGAKLKLNYSGREITYSGLRVVDDKGKELAARMEVKSATQLSIVVKDAAAYPVRIDPTFSDANWVSLGGLPGASGPVSAIVVNTNAGLVYVGGRFTAVGIVLATNIAVWNGTNWSAVGLGINNTVSALALDGAGNLYAGGSFTNAGGSPATNIAKWNGSDWSALGSGMNGTVSALAVDGSGNLYAGGAFTIAGGVAAQYVAQWNGSSWSGLGPGMNNTVSALAVDGSGNLYAGGAFTNAGGVSANYVAEWNGSTWSALGSGMNRPVFALAAAGAANLYAGGSFTSAGGVTANGVAQWNGSTWSALGSGTMVGSGVKSLSMDEAGNLYAGGNFIALGGVTTSGIAKWNGSAWSALGSGLGQSGTSVNAVAVDGLGTVYAGGSFYTAYFAPGDYVVKWNANAWSAIQSTVAGVRGQVFAVAADGLGNLYAGGQFVTAKWNGTNWSALGSGMIGGFGQTPQVSALVLDGRGNLYAGGRFISIGGVAAINVAKWDGSGWSALGSGSGRREENFVNALALDSSGNLYVGCDNLDMWNGSAWSDLGLSGSVNALTIAGSGNLYAGGYFNAPSTAGTHVAEWNGSTWSTVGSGVDGYVYSLAADKLGNVYAGGGFSSAGGVAAANIAKWNGNGWSALGSGTGAGFNDVFALALDPFGNLYAAGPFTVAGGVSARYVAKWDGIRWSALGSGLNTRAVALASDGLGHLFAGGSFTTAGTNYSAYVAQANIPQSLGMISINNNPGGALTMVFPGPPGRACVIQASTNLINWSTISTNICGTNGIWIVTNAQTGPQYFFRAALP